ncbi:MAG TPA: ABC transporter substrate-binding protein [Anaerolineae bacterium]
MSSSKNSQRNARKGWTILVGVIVVTLLLSGCAASQPKVYRVGILIGFAPFAEIADGFKAKMADLGYVEGKNITYDVQTVDVDPAKEQQVLQKFVADKVDLIFAFPTGPAVSAKAAAQGTGIPVVFAMAGLEETDLVESVRQPGGNITGVRFPGPENTMKRFEFLRQLAPQAKRVYLAYNANYPANANALEVLRPAAASEGVMLVEAPITSLEELKADLQTRAASDDLGMDAIFIMPDDLTQSPDGVPVIVEFAAKHHMPIGGAAAFWADAGALYSYVANFLEMGELAAPLADKIFKGSSAGTIPVVSPEQYLRLNYTAAQGLGLTVPEGLLSQAQEIIR